MIAVDTNVVVRLLTKDEESQHAKSLKIFKAESIFISDTVILETVWVLRKAYSFEPAQICELLRLLVGLPNVEVTSTHRLDQAIQWCTEGLDFADAFHLSCCQHCTALYTFDQKFILRAQSLTDCQVVKP
ncbi:MAG: type II toxin-antitoxin system VapC family toxin [Cyanobacteria bacterium J06606_4]